MRIQNSWYRADEIRCRLANEARLALSPGFTSYRSPTTPCMGRAKTQAREDGVWLRSRERVMQSSNIPTLYEWIGGIEALNRLTKRFYEHVNEYELLKPVFAHMDA